MTDPIETIQYKNHTIEVYPDPHPYDPREECDNLGVIITKNFWNESDIKGSDRDAVTDYIDEVEKANGIVLPIYCYSHGIDRFRTHAFRDGELPQGHARFDSGLCGFIVAELDKIREWFGVKYVTKKVREQTTRNLTGEIQTIDYYSSGQVYGFKLIDPNGEEIDSCWGYYGDYRYMVDEVKGQVDYIMRKPHSRQPVIELLGA